MWIYDWPREITSTIFENPKDIVLEIATKSLLFYLEATLEHPVSQSAIHSAGTEVLAEVPGWHWSLEQVTQRYESGNAVSVYDKGKEVI